MKTVLEQLEFTWWHFLIKMIDESEFIRNILPHFREIWHIRRKMGLSFIYALIGFPIGLLLAFLQSVGR